MDNGHILAHKVHISRPRAKRTVKSGTSASCGIAKQILSYFLRNPNGSDSLMELARWRLMQERIRITVEETQAALNWLVAEGYLEQEPRVGTESLFHLNPERIRDAESLLKDE